MKLIQHKTVKSNHIRYLPSSSGIWRDGMRAFNLFSLIESYCIPDRLLIKNMHSGIGQQNDALHNNIRSRKQYSSAVIAMHSFVTSRGSRGKLPRSRHAPVSRLYFTPSPTATLPAPLITCQ